MRQQAQFYSVSRQWLVRAGSAHINILEQLQLNITGAWSWDDFGEGSQGTGQPGVNWYSLYLQPQASPTGPATKCQSSPWLLLPGSASRKAPVSISGKTDINFRSQLPRHLVAFRTLRPTGWNGNDFLPGKLMFNCCVSAAWKCHRPSGQLAC